MISSKQNILRFLQLNDHGAITTLAIKKNNVITLLIRLTYDKDTLVGWRAIKAVGHIAQELVKSDCEYLRNTIRKLRWALSDESGGIGWSSPELIGEIVCADPRLFSDIVPLIADVYTIEEEVFRPGVLYALSRIAESAPDLVVPFMDCINAGLSDKNALVRFHALETIGKLKGLSGLSVNWYAVEQLKHDNSEVWVYFENDFVNATVGDAASKAIK